MNSSRVISAAMPTVTGFLLCCAVQTFRAISRDMDMPVVCKTSRYSASPNVGSFVICLLRQLLHLVRAVMHFGQPLTDLIDGHTVVTCCHLDRELALLHVECGTFNVQDSAHVLLLCRPSCLGTFTAGPFAVALSHAAGLIPE